MKALTKSRAITAGVALAIAGGFAATFTSTTSAPAQKIGTGSLAIALDTVAPTTWTDPIANLAAGDSVARYLDVRNSGTLKITGVNLSQTNTLGSLLSAPSDVSIKLEACSAAWTVATGACSGSLVSSLDSTALSGWTSGSKSLSGFSGLGAGDSVHLKLTTTLAQGAPNTVQAATGSITYSFDATQRVGGTDFNGAGVSNASSAPLVTGTYTWASNGDANGAFYALGNTSGTWTNPLTSGAVTGSYSAKNAASYGGAEALTDRTSSTVDSAMFHSPDVVNSWVQYDFGSQRMQVSDYSLRNRTSNSLHLMRNWKLQGSNDGVSFTDIDARTNDATASGQGSWGHFVSNQAGKSSAWRYVRLINTGLNSNSANYMTAKQIELYGTLS